MNAYFEHIIDCIIECDLNHTTLSENSATTLCLENYPKYLYKYRSCKQEHNFDMLENQYLWADYPRCFDDPFDSVINLKLKSELPAIQKWIYQHIGEIIYYHLPPKGMPKQKKGQTLQKYIQVQGQFVDSSGKYNAQMAKRIMTVEINKLNPERRREIQKIYNYFESTEFEEEFNQKIKIAIDTITENFRTKKLVCSLTERANNLKLWEDYADKYTGFVVEYDLSNVLEGDNKLKSTILHLFPVSYYKRMPKVELQPFLEYAFYKDLYGKKQDVSFAYKNLYKQLLNKQIDFKIEEEWRIIIDEQISQKIPFPLISCVYAGYKISENDLNRLKEICKKKGIALKKQELNPLNNEMTFKVIVKN